MRVVVADDSLLVREGLSGLLGRLGWEVLGTAVRAGWHHTIARFTPHLNRGRTR